MCIRDSINAEYMGISQQNKQKLYFLKMMNLAKFSSTINISNLLQFSIPIFQYHKNVIDHYQNPQNVGSLDKSKVTVGTGLVGSPACGDVLKLQIEVDKNGTIVDAKFKAFGCASAIASSSYATTLIKGKKMYEANNITNQQISNHLKLPPVKHHCSMLAKDAIKKAISDYKKKNPQVGGKQQGKLAGLCKTNPEKDCTCDDNCNTNCSDNCTDGGCGSTDTQCDSHKK
eukprot:TRINITY_DN240_c0_g2_i1.p1 TRINITY_DN240_c0_g2~~TRINITY_DN240_c0_g2_i1.p1  ORF type:complete len:229 (+),score=64.32 TRINITY_DN240_c0_g2_i1:82-768(+)